MRRAPVSTLRNLNINLELVQEILVGQNNERATITKIEFHERTGEININTTKGPRKALSFKLCSQDEEDYSNPADRYR